MRVHLQGAAEELLLAGIPEATVVRAAPIVGDFIARKISGEVTITLHFLEGRPMPSDLAMRERAVRGDLTAGER